MARPTDANEALHQLDQADLTSVLGRNEAQEALEVLREIDQASGLPSEVREIVEHAERELSAFSQAETASDARDFDEFSDAVGRLGYDRGQVDEAFTEDEQGRTQPRRAEGPRPDVPSMGQRSPHVDGGQESPGPDPASGQDPQIRDIADELGISYELAEQMFGDQLEADPNPFVGVPEDHQFVPQADQRVSPDRRVDTPGLFGAREPRYRESDVEGPFGWSAARIKQLQDRLVDAGLLSGEFRYGWYDEATGQAYARALGFANQRGQQVSSALDGLQRDHAQRQRDLRAEQRQEALDAFQPEPFLEPDPNSLAQRARQALTSIGRRRSDIDQAEIDQMVQVMSGDFKRAHQVQQEAARRMHVAGVETEFGDPTQADLSDLEEVDPIASFDEWFQSSDGFGGEIETRETSEEVARRGQTFDQGLSQMVSQVRGGR